MNTNKPSSCRMFEPAVRQPSYNQVIKMVKEAEEKLEAVLNEKRERLKIQTANETTAFRNEIHEKFSMLSEHEARAQYENLEKIKHDRELDRKKFVELQKLRQHFRGSEELRMEVSKRLTDECKRGRAVQVKQREIERKLALESENVEIQEARRLQLEELRKEEEAARMLKHEKLNVVRQELQKQIVKKVEKQKYQQTEYELEQKSRLQTDRLRKEKEKEVEMYRLKEKQSRMEFLQRQIEQRKTNEEYERQCELRYGKVVAEKAMQEMQKDAEAIEYAKRMQNIENAKYLDFMKRMKSDQKEMETEKFDLNHISLINEEIDELAEAKRQQKKQLLSKESKSEYIKNLKEKELKKFQKKQMESNELKVAERQNAEYEQMMAERKMQNRQKFLNDLQHQIKYKDMERAYNLERDTQHRKNVQEMNKASENLTGKLLDDGLDSVFVEHPFYQCIKSKNSNAF